METPDYPKSSNTLSIAGLALSVLAFFIALIPCFGMVAIIPALLSLIFAIIGLAHADRCRTPKSIAVVGIVIGTTALLVSGIWIKIISTYSDQAGDKIEKHVESILDDIHNDLKKTDIHIKIEEKDFSEEEISKINEDAEKAGEAVEKIINTILKDIESIDVESNDKQIIIRIPHHKLTDKEIDKLHKELKDLELALQDLIEGFSIKLELPIDESKK